VKEDFEEIKEKLLEIVSPIIRKLYEDQSSGFEFLAHKEL
jgi:hypothetical protein